MLFQASCGYDYHRPKKCERRVALRHRGAPASVRSEFTELLFRLGVRHERSHLETFGSVEDLSGIHEPEARQAATLSAIRSGTPAIYQGRLAASVVFDGERCQVVGEPDFLIFDGGRYRIRDSKLARHIDEKRHPEIVLQLQLYGWLYGQVVGSPAAALEVHAGTGEIVPVEFDGGEATLNFLRELRRMRLLPDDAYEPVGWSKCDGCVYRDLCWTEAEARKDVALLPHVDQKWARKLHDRGILDIASLAAAFHRPDLRDLFYDKATKKKPERIRASAASILESVEAHGSGTHRPIDHVVLPDPSAMVVLDLEGLPPYIDELEKIYLWGIKDFREASPRYLFAQAGFGPGGDLEGWKTFLDIVWHLIDSGSNPLFVHYGGYEKTKIELYLKRYGDPTGVAERLLGFLFDLYPAITNSVSLPVFSYGLKSVEKYIGFRRTIAEAHGAWAMSRYIEATETSDRILRDQIMGRILVYNEEDLDATRCVLEWLRENQPGPPEMAV